MSLCDTLKEKLNYKEKIQRCIVISRLGQSEPFHEYTPSKPSKGQPGQGVLPTFLILKAITISGFDLKFLYYQ